MAADKKNNRGKVKNDLESLYSSWADLSVELYKNREETISKENLLETNSAEILKRMKRIFEKVFKRIDYDTDIFLHAAMNSGSYQGGGGAYFDYSLIERFNLDGTKLEVQNVLKDMVILKYTKEGDDRCRYLTVPRCETEDETVEAILKKMKLRLTNIVKRTLEIVDSIKVTDAD